MNREQTGGEEGTNRAMQIKGNRATREARRTWRAWGQGVRWEAEGTRAVGESVRREARETWAVKGDRGFKGSKRNMNSNGTW